MVMNKNVGSVPLDGQHRGFYSKFVEPSQHSLGTLNMGKSQIQEADRMDPNTSASDRIRRF